MKAAATILLTLGALAACAESVPRGRPAPADRCFRSASVEAKIAELAPRIANDKLREIFVACYPNTLDTTVKGDGFVITGDIDAMWLRDSAAQVWPYLRYLREDAALKTLIADVLRRQFRSIRLDPYANAFNREPKDGCWMSDDTDMKRELHERKWEVDSLCYPLRLAYGYWQATGDASVFNAEWEATVGTILRTFRVQQKRLGNVTEYRFRRHSNLPTETLYGGHGRPVKPVGLIASGFRPSDDACLFPFHVPSNFFAVDVLGKAAEILREVNANAALASECEALAAEVKAALGRFAIAETEDFGPVYAYEVDGYGGRVLMDDANAPSLLSLPYLCGVDRNDPVYVNTRRFVLSAANPWFFSGAKAAAVGSPHTGLRRFWPMSLILQALTSTDDEEIVRCLETLVSTTGGTSFMHECVDVDDDTQYTRPWFAWANTLFGELIVELDARGRLDLVNRIGRDTLR